MIVRNRSDVACVDWGNGLSYRFLLRPDNMGFSVAHTTVRAGTKSRLQYRQHLEACYCIAGFGEVQTPDGAIHRLEPGVLYALDQNDAHFLIAGPDQDLELVSIFSPALRGDERHNLDVDGFSHYECAP
ncbi:ectoine synthase [Actinokineospora cianjurensis]|uniref:L-ectoine synthase n=1 Tax=Actinokineospora cianjurensis TaxID=585224 RepID=A0A421B0Q0_9PSEU|nr:ectoine synthase [Actinokineospora cianjurensis]RLK57940.1 L-ectoine synthase [Actinokineospora cianjurensis]